MKTHPIPPAPNEEPPTKVIFRKWPKSVGGDIIALFPEVPHDHMGWYCESYQHLGQHGACDPNITRCTKPAKPDEFASLKRELESIGYKLRVVSRFPSNAFTTRKALINKTQTSPTP